MEKLVVQKTSGFGHTIFHSVPDVGEIPEKGFQMVGSVSRIIWQGLEMEAEVEIEEQDSNVVQKEIVTEVTKKEGLQKETIVVDTEVEEK